MEFNSKHWMRLAVPNGKLIGTRTMAIPICPGYFIGVLLDRYSTKDMRRVSFFCGIGLDSESFLALRFCNEFISSIRIDKLEGMIPVVKQETHEYQKQFGNLASFANKNLEKLSKRPSANSVLDVVLAHYLDPVCPLPPFKLTEASIHQQASIEYDYEFAHVKTILKLQDEWQSPDYEQLKSVRIQNWVTKNRLKPDFFEPKSTSL